MMPGMDGYEVCRRLKSNLRTKDIPVVFITAMGQEEDEALGLEMGAIDYITKPIRPSILRARVHNHMELKHARDLLENLSATDGLTGIANRRRFDEVLDREWRRAFRNHHAIALIMLDIDFFKAYNDHYGHLAGDDVLRTLATVITNCMQRPGDLATRYGGEEFVCILPETDQEGARVVANRMRDSLASQAIPNDYSTVAKHVTVSMGVVSLVPERKQVPSSLIKMADESMYTAKRAGRNQMAVYGESMPNAPEIEPTKE
jgi:diguanylate cyclase (GGDEF)-like protein